MANWLDIVLGAILLILLIVGLIKGLIKEIIGIAAVIAGIILASRFYSYPGNFLNWLISEQVVSNFLGFLIFFFAVLAVGAVISSLLSKLMKGPLKFFNHILGGVFGFIEGILVCGVCVFALLVFPINTDVLLKSRIAPYCYGLTKGMIYLIPQELKAKFKDAYQNIVHGEKKNGKKV
ncbi:MAG: CvpA family protein [Candidatus Aminicenantales bacterium]